jgi:hypothetical protein
MAGLCQRSPTLFLAQSFDTSIHDSRSFGALRREKMWIKSSAGKRWTGDTRHRSSNSRWANSSCESSGGLSIPSEDCESFAWSMKESLSSSTPRSGDVEEEEFEEVLARRCIRRGRVAVDAIAMLKRKLWWWDESRVEVAGRGAALVRRQAVLVADTPDRRCGCCR